LALIVLLAFLDGYGYFVLVKQAVYSAIMDIIPLNRVSGKGPGPPGIGTV